MATLICKIWQPWIEKYQFIGFSWWQYWFWGKFWFSGLPCIFWHVYFAYIWLPWHGNFKILKFCQYYVPLWSTFSHLFKKSITYISSVQYSHSTEVMVDKTMGFLDLSWWNSGETTMILIKFWYFDIFRSGLPNWSKINMSKSTWQPWKSKFPPEPALASWKTYKLIFFNSGLPNFYIRVAISLLDIKIGFQKPYQILGKGST